MGYNLDLERLFPGVVIARRKGINSKSHYGFYPENIAIYERDTVRWFRSTDRSFRL